MKKFLLFGTLALSACGTLFSGHSSDFLAKALLNSSGEVNFVNTVLP